jgi:hypothetical protein
MAFLIIVQKDKILITQVTIIKYVRKSAAKYDTLASSHRPLCPEDNWTSTGQIYVKLDIAVLYSEIYRHISHLVKIREKYDSAREDLCTFMISCRGDLSLR